MITGITMQAGDSEPVTISREGWEALTARPGRRLASGGDPEATYPVPPAMDFIDTPEGEVEFLPADDLESLAEALIDAHDDALRDCRAVRIAYRWKAEGGETGGKPTWGTCQKANPLLRHFGRVDFVIWLAADHLAEKSAFAVEAVLFHELCVPAATIVTGPKAEAATARWYAGQMVEIRTASGRFLACTPNHPILTGRGWLPAALLVKGDDVFGGVDPERVASAMDPDEYQIPAPIEEIARTVGVAARPVPPAAEDFDANSIEGEVDVISADRQLRGGVQAALLQHVHQGGLGRRDAGAMVLACEGELLHGGFGVAMAAPRIAADGGHGLALALGHAGHPQPLGFAVGTDGHVRRTKDAFNRAAIGGEGGGERVPRFAGFVPLNDGGRIDIGSPRGGRFRQAGLSRVPRRDARRAEQLPDDMAADPVALRERLLRCPGGVMADQVVSVEVRQFSGHVYNLQTSQSWYAANSIITHNCHVGLTDKGKPTVKSHDLEEFAAVVRAYGIDWRGDLRRMAEAMQLALPLGGR